MAWSWRGSWRRSFGNVGIVTGFATRRSLPRCRRRTPASRPFARCVSEGYEGNRALHRGALAARDSELNVMATNAGGRCATINLFPHKEGESSRRADPGDRDHSDGADSIRHVTSFCRPGRRGRNAAIAQRQSGLAFVPLPTARSRLNQGRACIHTRYPLRVQLKKNQREGVRDLSRHPRRDRAFRGASEPERIWKGVVRS